MQHMQQQQQQQHSSRCMCMSMSMRVRVRVRMRTACRMHSIARNAAWHGSRAQWEGHMGWQDKNTRGVACNKHMQTYANACTKQNPAQKADSQSTSNQSDRQAGRQGI